MKPCTGMIFILLGLFVKEASGDNSTQVYYIELQIEAAAYSNFTALLTNLIVNVNGPAVGATITNISLTTECINNNQQAGTVNCSCNPGYRWSDYACSNYPTCCQKNNCTFLVPDLKAMCISSNTVYVSGSFTLPGQPFTSSLADTTSSIYQQFVQNYTIQLENIYSTLPWFNSLSITGLRQGSVIGDFTMIITDPFTSSQLQNATIVLQFTCNATFNLVVTDLTTITTVPETQGPIPYNGIITINCSTPEDMGTPAWYFQTNAYQSSQDVTTGTEATVTYSFKSSTVRISKTTEVWQGTFTCDYQPPSSNSIIYRASLYLDVALLPQITMISIPQFPGCTSSDKKQYDINVWCIVPNSTENYRVQWTGTSITFDTIVPQANGQVAYQAIQGIFCDERKEVYNVSCQFTNRKNQTTNANLTIPIIKDGSIVCIEDDINGWQKAKANFVAVELCDSSAVGIKTRNCAINGSWGPIVSGCVNRDLSDLLYDAMNLQRGLGIVEKNANQIFGRLTNSTEKPINTFANVNASVDVLQSMKSASAIQNSSWNGTVFPDFVKSSSNLLNDSLNQSWIPVASNDTYSLPLKFLNALEGVIMQTNLTSAQTVDNSKLVQDNIQMLLYNKSSPQTFLREFNVNVTDISSLISVQTAIMNLASKLPTNVNSTETIASGVILSVIAVNDSTNKLSMKFNQKRLQHHEMYCVYWNNSTSQWSSYGCTWGGVDNPNLCTCDHLSAFTILMAKDPINVPYLEELTTAGLSFSIVSLALGLVIELLVWSAVVKSNIAHFRHTVLVNLMVCMLIADCSFLAAHVPSSNTTNWCLILTFMRHFFFLASFFWMLCMSLGLLHQVIFVFDHLRKKVYLGLFIFFGYICPLVIVVAIFITFNNGQAGYYYSPDTCWLLYQSPLKGSIFAFIIPVFTIVIVNMFTMVVVIGRILKPTLSEGNTHDEKVVARSIVKTIVILSPILGITWILGLFMLVLDLTVEPLAQIVTYAFTFFNSFQGFFILITGWFGDKKVQDALLNRLRPQQSVTYKSESSTRTTSAVKKK